MGAVEDIKVPAIADTVTIKKEQLDQLIAQRNDAINERNELMESIDQIGNVVNFVRVQILGGKFPENEKEMDTLFYAKVAKNLVSVGFRFTRKPEVFSDLVNSLKYLIEVLPKYMTEEQLKRFEKNGQ